MSISGGMNLWLSFLYQDVILTLIRKDKIKCHLKGLMTHFAKGTEYLEVVQGTQYGVEGGMQMGDKLSSTIWCVIAH